MTLSPELLAIAAQWSPVQRAAIARPGRPGQQPNSGTGDSESASRTARATQGSKRSKRTAKRIRRGVRSALATANEAYAWQRTAYGKSRWQAVYGITGTMPYGTLRNAAMLASGYAPVDTGSEVYWASDGSHRKRKPPKRKRVDTSSPTMGRDNRPFDGTNARSRDGGVSQDYKPGTSAGYGHKLTERQGSKGRADARTFTVSFSVVFTTTPVELRSYVDDWSADRASARESATREFAGLIRDYKRSPWQISVTESGSEPVAMPDTSERVPISVTGVSRGAQTARETPNPFDGSYAEWRTAVLGAFRTVAYHASTGDVTTALRYLQDYRKWAVRRCIGRKADGDQRWIRAVCAVSEVLTALRGAKMGDDLRDMAETLGSRAMGWMLPA